MILFTTNMHQLVIIATILVIVSSVNFSLSDNSNQAPQLPSHFIYPYNIYQIIPNKEYMMVKLPNANANQDYNNIPLAINISCQKNQSRIQLQIVSNRYLWIASELTNHTNQGELKLVVVYLLDGNNYLFRRYSSNKNDQHSLKSLIIEEDRFVLSKYDQWAIATNDNIIRRVYIKNQSICYSGDKMKSQLKCFALYIRDIGYTSNRFNNELSFKVFRDYSKIDQIKFLTIAPIEDSKFMIVVGGSKVIYTLQSTASTLDFYGVFENSQNEVTGIYALPNNYSAMTFSNSSLNIKNKYYKNDQQYLCKVGNIKSCEVLNAKWLICKVSYLQYQIYDQKCNLIQTIDLLNQNNYITDNTDVIWRVRNNINSTNSDQYQIQGKIYQNQNYIIVVNKKFNTQLNKLINIPFNTQNTQINKNIQKQNQNKKQTTNQIFDHQMLTNLQKYRQKIADLYLSNLLNQKSNENNCELSRINAQIDEQPMHINFTKQDWKICKVTLNITSSYVMQMNENEQFHSSYKAIFCRMKSNDYQQKCVYGDLNLNQSMYLHRNSFYRIYILQNGKQFTNITLVNIQKMELKKVTNAFFVILAIILGCALAVICSILLKSTLLNLLIYYDLVSTEPEYIYPLNRLLLMIKIKRFIKKGFMTYNVKSKLQTKSTEGDSSFGQPEEVCCFCLQSLNHLNKTIQLYCRHQYHAKCFEEWMKKQPQTRCPYCKRQFTLSDMNDFKRAASPFKSKSMEELSI